MDLKLFDLVLIFTMYIRPLLEFAAPVWSPGLTVSQSDQIERVQRRALKMICWPESDSYRVLLQRFNLETLCDRRTLILTQFAKSLLLSDRHRHLLPQTRFDLTGLNLRNSQILHMPQTRTQRYRQSSIPSLIRLLN